MDDNENKSIRLMEITLAKNFLFLRTKFLHLTQTEFAKIINLSQGFVSDAENGKKVPGGPTLMRLQRLEFSLEFMTLNEGPIRNPLRNFSPETTEERIRFIREKKQLTEIELAEKLDFPLRELYELETDRRALSEKVEAWIVHKMGVNLRWLQEGKGTMDDQVAEEQVSTSVAILKKEIENLKETVAQLKEADPPVQTIIHAQSVYLNGPEEEEGNTPENSKILRFVSGKKQRVTDK